MKVWDEGLQNERTWLAWVRTATILAAAGMGGVGHALRSGGTPVAVPVFGLAALVGAVLLARTGARYRKVQRALHEGEPLDERADALLVWLGTLATAAGALLLVLP